LITPTRRRKDTQYKGFSAVDIGVTMVHYRFPK